jgi:hypothetical protein
MTGCFWVALLVGSGVSQAQNALLFVEPADGLFDGPSLLGTSVAISGKVAVVGGPNIDPPANTGPQETFLYQGAVNVYTTDSQRTPWTFETVIHPEDDDAPDQYFGVGVALRGRQLIVASTGALWIYERRKQGYEATDKLNFAAGESIPLFGGTQLLYENGVLAFKVIEQGVGSVVLIYKVDRNGQARRVAKLTAPNDPQHAGFTGGLSLNDAGDLLAIGRPGTTAQTPGSVYFYEPHGSSWRLSETLAAPGPEALGFGTGVSVHGKKLIVGAPAEGTFIDTLFNVTVNAGTVHVYRREHGHWVQVQTLAANDPSEPIDGLAAFGSDIVSNGRFVWITAPQDPESCASCAPVGYSSLYEWENGQLVYVQSAGLRLSGNYATGGGGLDISRRYVIVGSDDINFGNHAAIFDLALVEPDAAKEDRQPED